MGIFGRRRAAVAEWQPDGHGVGSMGDCGGDIQRGEDSYSARFVNADLPGRLVTIAYYPVEYDELPGEFVVQRQVEWMICEDIEDPGGTEIWSDVDYDDIEPPHDSVESAEQEARESAESSLRNGADINWDGEPFQSGD